MESLTEILKNGGMDDNTRQLLDKFECEFFHGLVDTIKAYKALDNNELITELADQNEGVKALLIELYNAIDSMSLTYNLKDFEHNSKLIQ